MTRRQLLTLLPGTFLTSLGVADPVDEPLIYPGFPSQSMDRVRAIVGAAHTNIETVKRLVGESPALAKAAVDWGYGDWETALGAACHTGQREIAEFLVANGARADIFFFAMMGKLDAVKAMIAADPSIAAVPGPHGIHLLAHAQAGGDEAKDVLVFLQSLPSSGGQPTPILSEAEKDVYFGKYSFGPTAEEYMDVYRHSQGHVMLRKGSVGSGSRLAKVGDHEFAPVGAMDVRVKFTVVNGRATELVIRDAAFVLSAKK